MQKQEVCIAPVLDQGYDYVIPNNIKNSYHDLVSIQCN